MSSAVLTFERLNQKKGRDEIEMKLKNLGNIIMITKLIYGSFQTEADEQILEPIDLVFQLIQVEWSCPLFLLAEGMAISR